MSRSRHARRLLLPALLFVAVVSCPIRADDQQRIAEIEKKLAELEKRIAELKKQPSSVAAKKPLTLSDADSWRSIRGAVLSGDGKWFAHRVAPAEGDGEVILRSISDGKETKFPGGGGFGQLQFSFDSKWLAFSVTPFVKPGGSASMTRPKTKLVVVNAATAEKVELEGTSFEFSEQSSTHIAYRKAPESPVAPPGARPASGEPQPKTGGAAAHTGTDLVLRDLSTGMEMVFGNVAEHSFDKKGTWLVMAIDAAGQIGNGVLLRDMKTGAVFPVDSAKAIYRGLAWNEEKTAFTITKAVDDPGYEGKWITLLGFSGLGPKPSRFAFDPKDDKDFPKDMAISPNRPAEWTEALDAFVFGIAERKKKDEPKKDDQTAQPVVNPKEAEKSTDANQEMQKKKKEGPAPKTGGSSETKPDLVIWHWKDERPQPMQQLQAAIDKRHTYTALYRIKEKKFLRLADATVKSVTPAPKDKFAIGHDTRPYEYMSHLDGRRYDDVYVIDMVTGARTKALTKNRYLDDAVPDRHAFPVLRRWHYFVYDMAVGKAVNITEKVMATSFVDAEDDHNVVKPPHAALGWSRERRHGAPVRRLGPVGGEATDGSGGVNLTGNGKSGRHPLSWARRSLSRIPSRDTICRSRSMSAHVRRVDEKAGHRPGSTRANQESSGSCWGDCSVSAPDQGPGTRTCSHSTRADRDRISRLLLDRTQRSRTSKKATDANPQQKELPMVVRGRN